MKKKIILIILLLGVLYKLLMTWNGNFLFNMDNARDMVDVRQMMVLKKWRLIGPTSAIEGVYNGPAWYYLLAIPYLLSGGNPYAAIIMEIILWAVGGFFLLRLVGKWSNVLLVPLGLLWIASNYIGLTTSYAFNPNPVTLLSPLFIFLLYKYLKTEKLIYSIGAFFLGGLFFNFEMNEGVFMPVIIFIATLLYKKELLKSKNFWLGSLFFILCLLPQLIFELKHHFFMTRSLLNFLRNQPALGYNFAGRFRIIFDDFHSTLVPTLLNNNFLTWSVLLLSIPALSRFLRDGKKDILVLIVLSVIMVPFLGYLILPVTVNAWHLGMEMTALILLSAYVLKQIWRISFTGKLAAFFLSIVFIWVSLGNITNFFTKDFHSPNNDPSLYKNEVAAIDYVYKRAKGQNFKVYVYLPSVIDYPYQYLFWWYGRKTYGYLPADYAYEPNKPQYIADKNKFSPSSGELAQRTNSHLVFLIKEPNRNYTRYGWEGDLIKYRWQSIGIEMVGLLEIETRIEK